MRVSLCLNKGERNVGAVCVRTRVCITKRMYVPLSILKYNQIILQRYHSPEREAYFNSVIFVMVSVLFKKTKEGLVSKGC